MDAAAACRRCPASRWSRRWSRVRCSSSSAGTGRARATGPPKGFVPFTGAANIPVGSQLDTSKGRVELTSAADTAGEKTQTSRVLRRDLPGQAVGPEEEAQEGQGVDHRSGDEGSDRAVAVRAVEGCAARRRPRRRRARRRCWGSCGAAGRASSARTASTARRRCAGRSGWCEDRCEGTLTKVTRGTVSVRDFKRKKTVTVKAGHSYLARAQRAASKSKR